jgi:hypothetical protein
MIENSFVYLLAFQLFRSVWPISFKVRILDRFQTGSYNCLSFASLILKLKKRICARNFPLVFEHISIEHDVRYTSSTMKNRVTPAFTLVYSFAYSILKMEAICSSGTLVTFQHSTRRYIPEDITLRNHRCQNLKSCIVYTTFLPFLYYHTNAFSLQFFIPMHNIQLWSGLINILRTLLIYTCTLSIYLLH